jgi:hypothetical protein
MEPSQTRPREALRLPDICFLGDGEKGR